MPEPPSFTETFILLGRAYGTSIHQMAEAFNHLSDGLKFHSHGVWVELHTVNPGIKGYSLYEEPEGGKPLGSDHARLKPKIKNPKQDVPFYVKNEKRKRRKNRSSGSRRKVRQ